MGAIDPFTRRRLLKFIGDHRARTGGLPTLRALEEGGFSKDVIGSAVREKAIEMIYVTLTDGSVVKGFKIVVDGPF